MFTDPTTDVGDSIPSLAAPLTEDQQSVHEEIVSHITTMHAVPEIATNRADKAVSAGRCTYTSELLACLAEWHRHVGDNDEIGARMLERFARDFAAHEATVV
jgi:hypothetical protein